MRTLLALAVTAATVAPMACAEGGRTVDEAAESINEADYLRKVAIISADSMMGRDTPSEGLEMTADWIASEFERYGLEPGGDDGTYIQRWPYPAYGQDWDATTVTVEGGPALTLGADLAYTGSPADGEFTGEVTLLTGAAPAGEDRRATFQAIRDALQGAEFEGRHVVVLSPDASDLARFVQGAAAVFVVSDLDDEGWQAFVEDQRKDVDRTYGGAPEFDGSPEFAIRRDAAMALLESGGIAAPEADGAIRTRPLPGLSITVNAAAGQVDDAQAPNVVGILPGSDPALAGEYVVFSAHMDHVGVNPGRARQDSVFDASGAFVRMETDSIFNGADDDASGTIAVVEVAEAFAMLAEPPRRSMVFLLVSGEEKGLLGRRYYSDNPTVPAE
ncbi:MAG TPA: M28 family peptidase, partial [Longimicrobiales bacterium]|nr:M28 family peptidase [Longimicrobiales bacterium]